MQLYNTEGCILHLSTRPEDRAWHRHQRRKDNGRHSGAEGVGCAAEHKRGLPAADREAGVEDDAHEVQGRHQTEPEPASEGADSIGHFYLLLFFVFCGLKVLNSGNMLICLFE